MAAEVGAVDLDLALGAVACLIGRHRLAQLGGEDEARLVADVEVATAGALDVIMRRALVRTSPATRGADIAGLLEWLDRAYGPAPGQACRPVVLVLDDGRIHTSNATARAFGPALARGGLAAPVGAGTRLDRGHLARPRAPPPRAPHLPRRPTTSAAPSIRPSPR
jgi:hypothetical protein